MSSATESARSPSPPAIRAPSLLDRRKPARKSYESRAQVPGNRSTILTAVRRAMGRRGGDHPARAHGGTDARLARQRPSPDEASVPEIDVGAGHRLDSPSGTGIARHTRPWREAGNEAGSEAENEGPREAMDALHDVAAGRPARRDTSHLSRRRPQDGDALHPCTRTRRHRRPTRTHAQLPSPDTRFRE
jgi:hypothetical protein